MWLLLLLFVVVNATCDRATILGCFSTWVDTNGDGFVSPGEIDAIIANEYCGTFGIPDLNGTNIVHECDSDGDMLLSAVDYDAQYGCMRMAGLPMFLCNACARCMLPAPAPTATPTGVPSI